MSRTLSDIGKESNQLMKWNFLKIYQVQMIETDKKIVIYLTENSFGEWRILKGASQPHAHDMQTHTHTQHN